ncbi:ribonuclease H-like domain-containing protein [Schizothecium vesticola]|uniref:ribonuclease H n=1 Tax=Schizothecium vesticola TaxID=314040 RepID=A0AA40EQ84_9PEZI|nr:ribonuclease H-like domain-containing protein [Schizothecium vesticola]
MPRGWYLAQGLIPLGYSSSDDEEGPCELPDGRLVCGPHGFVRCHRCCSDYSFMDELLDGEDDNDEDDNDRTDSSLPDLVAADWDHVPVYAADTGDNGLGPRRGTGRAFPTKFVPPSTATPSVLFSGHKRHMNVTRYTLPNDPRQALIRTDGACLDNGRENPKAGWAFWHGFGPSGNLLVASGRLEKKGPFGDDAPQTSNRAELRAVIAALRFRYWPGEGFRTLVVATDSEYVVEGSTNWAKRWVENGWVTRAGNAVQNRDLWEALLGEVERYQEEGMAIEFWRVSRDWNTVADAAAKGAAAEAEAPNAWAEVMGINI